MKLKIELMTKSPNGRDLCIEIMEILFKSLCAERVTPTVDEDGRYCLIVEMTVKDVYCWHEKLSLFFKMHEQDRKPMKKAA